MKAPGAVKTGEIEMLAGIVLKNSKKAGVFRKVKISAPADIVKLAKGSLGTAGNAKITGLTTQILWFKHKANYCSAWAWKTCKRFRLCRYQF